MERSTADTKKKSCRVTLSCQLFTTVRLEVPSQLGMIENSAGTIFAFDKCHQVIHRNPLKSYPYVIIMKCQFTGLITAYMVAFSMEI